MRRLLIWTASLGCLFAGVIVGAAVELGSLDTATQRFAPVIAGSSMALAIMVLGSRRRAHLTKNLRFGLASFSAFGWLVGMIAVTGWILESPGWCSGAVLENPKFKALAESGVDLCPHVTAARAAQNRVLLAGVIGFFVILAVGLYVRFRDKRAERNERETPTLPREPSRT
jgi:hypothetical protein